MVSRLTILMETKPVKRAASASVVHMVRWRGTGPSGPLCASQRRPARAGVVRVWRPVRSALGTERRANVPAPPRAGAARGGGQTGGVPERRLPALGQGPCRAVGLVRRTQPDRAGGAGGYAGEWAGDGGRWRQLRRTRRALAKECRHTGPCFFPCATWGLRGTGR